MKQVSRRTFVGGAAAMAIASGAAAASSSAAVSSSSASSFFDLIRVPERVAIYLDSQKDAVTLTRSGSRWQGRGVEVTTAIDAAALRISVTAPSTAITRIQLRWKLQPKDSLLYMGDAWERSYGDLAWRTTVPERVMPWYFAANDGAKNGSGNRAGNGTSTHAYGVMTGAAAFCFWQVDPEGVSLWLDVSNGGLGVMLGQRELAAATVVSRRGHANELPHEALTDFCRKMCPHPRLPSGPIYGTNDWYYAYGENTAEGILRDTDLVVALAPKTGPTPYSVIDGGWGGSGSSNTSAVPNPRFPDMPGLADQIRSHGARPGIWIRPMEAPKKAPPELLLPMSRFQSHNANDDGKDAAYDPTVPEAMQAVLAKMKQVVDWKYELVKHDYSTYDLLGQWGSAMCASPTRPGWSFHDRSRTNAEIILDVYQQLRTTAGEQTLILGCNTVGHLAAGVFEMNRTGDDTSGRVWERTRRMGVNTLAYRLPQNRTFFIMDADCVGITRSIPWELNRQWMDLLARSGSALLISPSPDATGPEQRAAIQEAFAIAASGKGSAHPVDWLTETTPENWKFQAVTKRYEWCGESGCDPSPI